VVERFAAFNSIWYMSQHWGALKKTPDADLDIEYHIPSSRAMLDDKKSCCRIYCYRLFLLSEYCVNPREGGGVYIKHNQGILLKLIFLWSCGENNVGKVVILSVLGTYLTQNITFVDAHHK